MAKDEIIASLLDQAQDKDSLNNGKADNIFAEDAKALRETAEQLVESRGIRHGHWVHCAGKSALWYCSNCGERIIYNPDRHVYNTRKKGVAEVNRFCRGCGAKMDGGEAK